MGGKITKLLGVGGWGQLNRTIQIIGSLKMTSLRICARIHNVVQFSPSLMGSYSRKNICARLHLKQGTEIQDFTFWDKMFQRDAPAKDELVFKKQAKLCQVVWGIVIKNFTHKYFFIVIVALGFKFQVHSFFCSVGREGSGTMNFPTLWWRAF